MPARGMMPDMEETPEGPPHVPGTALERDPRASVHQGGVPNRAGMLLVGAVSRAGSWLDVASGGRGTPAVPVLVDIGIGAAGFAAGGAVSVVRLGGRVVAPVGAVLMHPPLLPRTWHPASLVSAVGDRGRHYRQASEREVDAVTAALVPRVIAAVLDRIDLTELVLRRVDLDRVVASVDVLAAVQRLDLTAIVLEGVELDSIVAGVDIEAIVDRLDIAAIVAGVDLDAIITRVDPDPIADRVNVQAVIDRIDLVGLAKYVVQEIDLPEIIRESTGSVASEAVRGARMQSIEADQAVQRAVDRLLLRRRHRPTETTEPPRPTGEGPGA